jgi:chemotaxis protein methyltransferase CheR
VGAGVPLRLLATDVDEAVLARARAADYPESSLRELPQPWRDAAFVRHDGAYELRPTFRQPVTVLRHDLRQGLPDGPFDLVLCRNVAFTYFDLELQHEVAARLAAGLRRGGELVLGAHETLPEATHGFVPWSDGHAVSRRG